MDSKKLNKVIGKNIKKIREKRGLTLYDMEDEMELSYESITRIEYGTRGTNIKNLIKFADILSVNLDDLIKGWENC